MKKTVLVKAPAKVNLYLKVLGRREDGYHEILSLMQMVGLYDFLALREEPSDIRLTIENASSLPADRSNLVFRAAEALQKAAFQGKARSKGVSIRLTKNIPIAAGLGGGSSDAAATLVGLNRLWGLRWPRERLARLGATLGSDVPFFLYGPTAWASGRGDEVEPATGERSGMDGAGQPRNRRLDCLGLSGVFAKIRVDKKRPGDYYKQIYCAQTFFKGDLSPPS
ncbi:MAG: 4-(cytidine 5'-diphospho)-2-C-methyl-D-erythritol kinase [Candidatus Manganitrophus sp.]|nr:4-(cytidine 5'-diphospho)-2-C-methyl-D-erythritol kinase [Candidatus Manganitrophus sp.]